MFAVWLFPVVGRQYLQKTLLAGGLLKHALSLLLLPLPLRLDFIDKAVVSYLVLLEDFLFEVFPLCHFRIEILIDHVQAINVVLDIDWNEMVVLF